jgi:predicted aminopeptidase
MQMRKSVRVAVGVLVLGIFAVAVPGCSTLGYYGQSFSGHMDLMAKRRPLDEVIADPTTPEKVKTRLMQAKAFRAYASQALLLPDNRSYLQYADLERPYVVWNVVATPEFSLEPVPSCFWVVGCMSYRGYFAKDEAQRAAAAYQQQGHDTYVGGVAAYSTLGWFEDPLLNTMLSWSDYRLAGLIFHELAHQQVYIRNDTAFNEAFASSIEREGVRRWLAEHGDAAQRQEYEASFARGEAFSALVLRFRDQLNALYAQPLGANDLRPLKQAAYRQLQADYEQLKTEQWDGYAGYDNWFKNVNNAKIALFSTYDEKIKGFEALLGRVDGNLYRYYCAVALLGEYPQAQREACLSDARQCPSDIF